MKHQSLFSSKDRNKKIKVSSAAILLCSLRVGLNSIYLKNDKYVIYRVHWIGFDRKH